MNVTWFALLWGVFAIAVGSVNAVAPRRAWRANRWMNSWQYRGGQSPEPSATYLVFARVLGGIFVVVGVVAIVWFVVQLTH